jgi:hypothetical protein
VAADIVRDGVLYWRAAAFASGRSMNDVAQDAVEQRVRFDE